MEKQSMTHPLTSTSGLKTSAGLSITLKQAIQKLGRDIHEAEQRATTLLTPATDIEIERAIRSLQVIKGKTYAKALIKENGKALNEIAFDIGISMMLKKHHITQAELPLWFEEAEKTRFEGHLFQPLPDKADAWRVFMKVRDKIYPLRAAAEDLQGMQKQNLLPRSIRLSRRGVLTALDLGMWNLFSPEQKQESFSLLEWHELPKEAKLDFFRSLPEDDQSRIFTLLDQNAREAATRKMFCRKLNKLDPGKQQ